MYYVMLEHPKTKGDRSSFEFVGWFERKNQALAFRDKMMAAGILGGHIKVLEPTKL